MHLKKDNIGIMMNDQTDEIIELLESLKNRYQKNLESMRYNGFVFMFIYCIINVIK